MTILLFVAFILIAAPKLLQTTKPYPATQPHEVLLFVMPDNTLQGYSYDMNIYVKTSFANLKVVGKKTYPPVVLIKQVSDRFPDITDISVTINGRTAKLHFYNPIEWFDIGRTERKYTIGIPVVIDRDYVLISVCANPYIYIGNIDRKPHFSSAICTKPVKVKYGDVVKVNARFEYSVQV